MTARRRPGCAAAAIGLLALALPLEAAGQPPGPPTTQAPPGQPPPGLQRRGGPPEGPSIAEIERYLDRFELHQAQRALGMDDAAFAPVGQRMQRIQNLRRRQRAQRLLALGDLRDAVETGRVDEDAAGMAARLAELGDLGVRHAQELRRALQALDALLTVRQRVQFRLFLERFERQKVDLVLRARQGRGGAPPPGPPRR
jgi:hypothetical protein